jgi:hypothetical protein
VFSQFFVNEEYHSHNFWHLQVGVSGDEDIQWELELIKGLVSLCIEPDT